MTDVNLSTVGFPRFREKVTGQCAPIYLEPLAGSGERFVVAVAVVSTNNFNLEQENALDQLNCFYSNTSAAVRFTTMIIIEHLRNALASRSIEP